MSNKRAISIHALAAFSDTTEDHAASILNGEFSHSGDFCTQLDALLHSIFAPYVNGGDDIKDVTDNLGYAIDQLQKTRQHLHELARLEDELEKLREERREIQYKIGAVEDILNARFYRGY